MDPHVRFLPPTPATGYVVGASETLAQALHRLTTEQFSIAIDALTDPEADVGIATAASLQSVRRISAVLRLVRTVIGDEAYESEQAVLYETDALLAALVAGQPELRALDQLRARYSHVLQPAAFVGFRQQLLHRHQLRRLTALAEGEALQRSLHRLRRARARFAAWPIDATNEARMYGRDPVGDSFESLGSGLGRTYRRGRKQWAKAGKGQLDVLDDWHQECRLLGHQLEIIRSSWPEVIGAVAETCSRLEAILGETQGLMALDEVARHESEGVLGSDERAMLAALVAHGIDERLDVATALGGRVFAEPSDQFLDRMEAYWLARGLSAEAPGT